MKILNFILILFFSITISAQKKTTLRYLDSLPNTVENQFLKILKRGNSWHEFKMVKKTDFISFQKNILDSVSSIKKDVIEKNKIITAQKENISSLTDNINKLKQELTVAVEKEDSVSLLGAQVQKGIYNTILFGIILGLLIALLFFIFKYKNSLAITNTANKSLSQIEEEFEMHRKKSIENEQKLRRKLQDEINKQRGV